MGGVCALTLATACAETIPVDSSPDLLWAESFRWESTPGIELESPTAAVVRAAVESDAITLSLGRKYAYPGYADAAGDHGTSRYKWPAGAIGTLAMNLIELEQSPNSLSAFVCIDTTGIASPEEGRYPLPATDPFYVLHAYRISAQRDHTMPDAAPPTEVSTPATATTLPGPPGRNFRPTENVFDNWELTEFAMSAAPEDIQRCRPWAKQRWGGPNPPVPTRTEAEPPVVEPFHPGW
ncbi:hypothetical protein [Prescottella subtropica]|uniref:hypothetical protein n=1 Tax=Prescottella subtropica TaxID=2545757 RepID=UPI0010F9F3CB|nr:hypothetical protein [Prescottella subtropica]